MAFVTRIFNYALIAALAWCGLVLVGIAGQSLHWAFDLLGQFLLPAVLVSAVVALGAGVLRRMGMATLALGIAVVAALVAAPWTSTPPLVAKEAPRFSVLLFNVWFGNKKMSELAAVIQKHNPDMVVLVEATERMRLELQTLSTLYPYRLGCLGVDACDILIFSRSRLVAKEIKSTQDPEHSPLLKVSTEFAGCPLMIFATHMTRPFPNTPYTAQREQAHEIGTDAGQWSGAKLVLGDFNAAPWAYVMSTIAKKGRVKLLTGSGGTWPSFLPAHLRIPIDHILVSDGLSFVSRRVLPTIGSDHAPVLAEIAVTDRHKCR